jgi:FlaG/FlaF family flagellin (archaellin)
MTESGRIGVKAVSTVIAAVIVLTVFLGLASAIYTGLLQLGNESSNLVKREAERAMESFFQIYWLNNTHVVLFNNHSSVPVTLLYWVSVNPASGAYTVTPLNPATYTVPPGTRYIIQNPPALYRSSLNPVNRVVSERGTSFEVGDAPSQPFQHFTLVNSRKLVRPGFTSILHGPISRIILSTGPGFLGGPVTLTCVAAYPAPASCAGWSVNFNPPSPVNVPSNGYAVVDITANIPTSTPTGTYFIRVKADTGGVSRELVLVVDVGDFNVAVNPTPINIRRGCAATLTLNIINPTNYDGRVSFRVSSVSPPDDRLNFMISPNPVEITHGLSSSLVIFVNNITVPGPPTRTVTMEAFDGLGQPRTTSLTVTVTGGGGC